MKNIILIISTMILISCGSTKVTTPSAVATTPTTADLERGKTKYPDLTMESLTIGKSHFEQQCTKCHSMKKPDSKTAEQWHAIVPKMAEKAKKKAGSEVIDA